MVLLAALLSTALVLTHHAHQAHANIDFTVDLGYSKYVGTAAADNKIVKWLGIRYAAPPVGNNRFRAPQDPVKDGKTNQANKVCGIPSLLMYPTDDRSSGISVSRPHPLVSRLVPLKTVSSSMCTAPVDNSKSRPVFVYIQGGGLNSNGGSEL